MRHMQLEHQKLYIVLNRSFGGFRSRTCLARGLLQLLSIQLVVSGNGKV